MAFSVRLIANIYGRALYEIQNASMSLLSCSRAFPVSKADVCGRQILAPINPELQLIRTNVRKFFPRPSERKRINRHSYEQRLKTPSGRAVIMRRILKGRFVLSH